MSRTTAPLDRQHRDARRRPPAAREGEPGAERREAPAEAQAPGARDLGAAQQRDRRPRRRPPRGPGRGGGDHRRRSRRSAPASGASSAQPGGCSLSASSRSPAAPRTASAPIAIPSTPATAPVRVARQRVLGGDPPAREPDRALHADGRQAALDVGRRGGREHRRRGAQRDEREGDEQRDDDPRRRVDEHAHAAAGDEAHAADLGAGGARLLQQHVDPAGVGGPDERLVDRQALLGLGFESTRARRRSAAPRPAGRRRCRAPRRSPPRAAPPSRPTLIVVADAPGATRWPRRARSRPRCGRPSTSRPATIA